MATPMKKTNSNQFARLVDLMKENVEIARGFCGVGSSKIDVKEKWKEIGKELDALGPPMRLGSEWQKVWIDMRGKVKKILAENKRELRATGGGPNKIKKLTPLQQEIDKLLSISANINPVGNSFGCGEGSDLNNNENIPPNSVGYDNDLGGTAAYVAPAVNNANAAEIDLDQPPAVHSNPHSTPRPPKRRRAVVEERSELLKKQTDIQEQTLNKFKKIEENTYKTAKNLQKLVNAQIEQNQILKDDARQRALDNLEKRKLKVRELELKKKEIELKQRELDLKEASMQ